MGHFVGDASQPLHNSADYDGWETGHGGLHSFYETTCVATYGLDLTNDVYERAKAIRARGGEADAKLGVLELIKEVSVSAFHDKPKVEALDATIEPSRIEKDPATGKTNRIYAKRASPEVACPKFRAMTVRQLASSAARLAELWDRAYAEGGRPALDKYKIYRYPLEPDYVAPTYIDQAARVPASVKK